MEPLVLYVDNDIANLVQFETSLEGALSYRTATHPAEALRILDSEEIGVLLVGEVGADFLEQVRRSHPDTVRLILADALVLDEGDGEKSPSIYLRPPWTAQALRFALQTALERYRAARHRRELEAKLRAAERVYALGVAAAELAHEIRSPLGSIASNLRMATDALCRLRDARATDDDLPAQVDAVVRMLEDCTEGVAAITEITRSMEQATSSSEAESLDLAEVVRLTIRTLEMAPERRGIIGLEAPDLPRVRGHRTRLGQVVTNLLTNAVQAAQAAEHDDPRVLVRLWHEGDEVFMEVRDNGPGMEPEVLARIFDPFFTTKAEGGTGLGLVISRRIVEEHGGRIQVFTKVHEGSRFLVMLPAAPNH